MTPRQSFWIVTIFYTILVIFVFSLTGSRVLESFNPDFDSLYSGNWAGSTLLNSGAVAAWWYGIWPAWVQLNTIVNEHGVQQPRFWGMRWIRWSDVTGIAIDDGVIATVTSDNDRIVIKAASPEMLEHLLSSFRHYLSDDRIGYAPASRVAFNEGRSLLPHQPGHSWLGELRTATRRIGTIRHTRRVDVQASTTLDNPTPPKKIHEVEERKILGPPES